MAIIAGTLSLSSTGIPTNIPGSPVEIMSVQVDNSATAANEVITFPQPYAKVPTILAITAETTDGEGAVAYHTLTTTSITLRHTDGSGSADPIFKVLLQGDHNV